MDRPRVLVLHPALTPYRIDLFNALAESFTLKTLFFRANPVSQSFDQTALRQQLHCEHGDLTRGVDVWGRQFRWGVGGAIRAFQPRVVVAMEYAPSTWMAAWERMIGNHRFGLVLWTADNVEMCANASRLRALARTLMLSRADGLVVYTTATRDWYARHGFDGERIAVCANINRPEHFRAQLEEGRTLARTLFHRHQLGGTRLFLSVGRLAAIKGVDRILAAFQRVQRQHPETRLAIVGDGVQRNHLESLAREAGLERAVIFTGQLQAQELRAWYLLGQVFILASAFEPYGAVVHEALTAGIPVICSRVAGARDLIIDGDNGWLFDPWDIEELARCMTLAMAGCLPVELPGDVLPASLMPVSFTEGVSQFVRLLQRTITSQRGLP
ncbi:MAG: glycosyltransferase [Magnetococcales bacterium]|nr:glycosyltransferase [Magnetococcales bacterium]MBF0348289.1 glycosyltransferase [Magnetococcales bacterium]MBF0632373.1 glycosyltransferase [Magnetococcales bacterium]